MRFPRPRQFTDNPKQYAACRCQIASLSCSRLMSTGHTRASPTSCIQYALMITRMGRYLSGDIFLFPSASEIFAISIATCHVFDSGCRANIVDARYTRLLASRAPRCYGMIPDPYFCSARGGLGQRVSLRSAFDISFPAPPPLLFLATPDL